ncbi:MAG: hypothetical protein HZR80_16870 [Candidatus Heimdallarchaeota archaeon]
MENIVGTIEFDIKKSFGTRFFEIDSFLDYIPNIIKDLGLLSSKEEDYIVEKLEFEKISDDINIDLKQMTKDLFEYMPLITITGKNDIGVMRISPTKIIVFFGNKGYPPFIKKENKKSKKKKEKNEKETELINSDLKLFIENINAIILPLLTYIAGLSGSDPTIHFKIETNFQQQIFIDTPINENLIFHCVKEVLHSKLNKFKNLKTRSIGFDFKLKDEIDCDFYINLKNKTVSLTLNDKIPIGKMNIINLIVNNKEICYDIINSTIK